MSCCWHAGAEAGLGRDEVGKINVNDFSTYVAVRRDVARQAMDALNRGKVKGKSLKCRLLNEA